MQRNTAVPGGQGAAPRSDAGVRDMVEPKRPALWPAVIAASLIALAAGAVAALACNAVGACA